MLADAILILCISVFTALLAEGIFKVKYLLDYISFFCVYIHMPSIMPMLVVIELCVLGITYLLVYRTEKYKKLKAEVEKHSKKLERKKETTTDMSGGQKKKIERVEEKLKNNNRDLSMVKMKSMFAIGFTFTALMGMFNSIFDGRVVAKLPFVPISWFQNLSHRNLPGSDYTDCSFIFLYILCTMSIRQNIQKLLGFAPSRAANKAPGFLTPAPATK